MASDPVPRFTANAAGVVWRCLAHHPSPDAVNQALKKLDAELVEANKRPAVKTGVIPGDPVPYGLSCFLMMLPGGTEDDARKAMQIVTDALAAYERSIGGQGLSILRPGWEAPGKWSWLVDPILKDPPYVSQRMALLAVKLREQENLMAGV